MWAFVTFTTSFHYVEALKNTLSFPPSHKFPYLALKILHHKEFSEVKDLHLYFQIKAIYIFFMSFSPNPLASSGKQILSHFT